MLLGNSEGLQPVANIPNSSSCSVSTCITSTLSLIKNELELEFIHQPAVTHILVMIYSDFSHDASSAYSLQCNSVNIFYGKLLKKYFLVTRNKERTLKH